MIFSVFSYCQVKKIPAMIGGKLDTLNFPNDFKNKNGIPIGQDLPYFSYVDIDNNTIRNTDFEGKLLVLNFWFVGCVGCKQEEPYLKKLTEHFENDKVEFVSICQSNESKTRAYLNKYGDFGYKVISIKSKKEVFKMFGVELFTTHIIVNNGKVVENLSFPLTTDDEIEWFKRRIIDELTTGM